MQPSSTIRFYVQGPASKVGISAYSPKEYRASKISTNEGTFGSLVNVWVNGFRKGRFGVHAGSKAKQYIVAEVIFPFLPYFLVILPFFLVSMPFLLLFCLI